MGFFSTKKKLAGLMAISIGQDGIYAASVERSAASKPSLQWLSFHALADKPLHELLERVCRDVNAKRYHCSLLMLPGEYQLFSVDALNVPAEELKSAMRWRLKDLLDYHVNDATVDVLDVPSDKGAGGRSHTMFAVAARNQLISERQAAFLAADIPLRVIDIPDLAQRNLSALLEEEQRGLAMLSFDLYGGLLTVTFGGELYLSRRLDIHLEQLQTLDENLKATIFERITLELQRSLDHFDRQHHSVNTSKLVLSPMGKVAAQLQAYLASNLYLPVEILNLSSIIDVSKIPELPDLERQQAALMTIGAALRQEAVTL